MDGPRYCHTEQSQSDRERQISYDISFVWNLKIGYKWPYIQNISRVNKCRKQTWLPGRAFEGRDKRGDWEWHTLTAIYKIDN